MEHSLYARTAAAGIYDLRPGTSVSNELAALDAGLSRARELLSDITDALYPLSAPYEMGMASRPVWTGRCCGARPRRWRIRPAVRAPRSRRIFVCSAVRSG